MAPKDKFEDKRFEEAGKAREKDKSVPEFGEVKTAKDFLTKATKISENFVKLDCFLEANMKIKKEILHEMASKTSYATWAAAVSNLLRWIAHSHDDLFETVKGRPLFKSDTTFVHAAIFNKNNDFLERILDFCQQNQSHSKRLLEAKFEDGNCLHHAIDEKLPCVARMIQMSPTSALQMKNKDGRTPFHLAMTSLDGAPLPVYDQSQPLVDDPTPPEANIGRQLGSFDPATLRGKRRAPIIGKFTAPEVFEAFKRLKNTKLLLELLAETDNFGNSPYQDRATVMKSYMDEHPEQKKLQHELRSLIFTHFKRFAPDIRKALYGTRASTQKEVCLDMSDFNRSTHDFGNFVQKLRGEKVVFEDTLLYVYLPDLNYFPKTCPHEGVRSLFEWLAKKGKPEATDRVDTIMELNIPDNTTAPMSDELAKEAIIDDFKINILDWRKLDINLDILTDSGNRECFTELTLYSSGNWSTLYHWSSIDGLGQLPNLEKVTIKIVTLNPSEKVHDGKAQAKHEAMAQTYKTRLINRLYKLKRKELKKLKIDENCVELGATWEYAKLPDSYGSIADDPGKLKFLSQLTYCQNFLGNLFYNKVPSDWDEAIADSKKLLQNFEQLWNFKGHEYNENGVDRRIKVAVIDNGTDRIKGGFKTQIATGISYVTATSESKDRILPWWTVADSHGTQMASYISQVNQYCRLYIARVGKGRRDILPGNAVKAIDWAIEQNVDIISISWTKRKADGGLESAIKRAAQGDPTKNHRPILVFCSTADEGEYGGEAWPVDGSEVIRVAATDQYGHRMNTSKQDKVHVFVPGEDMEADRPSYIQDWDATRDPLKASGSSVATALAAGIASLILLMFRLFNDVDNPEIEEFRKKDKMLKVFKKMQSNDDVTTGVLLHKLFPPNCMELQSQWDLKNFE